jgi:hypothetical protein
LFTNINLAYVYVTATEVFPGSDSYRAFVFNHPLSVGSVSYDWGYQGTAGKAFPAVAMVLSDGDVAAAVPEPPGHLIVLAGLCALAWASRRSAR